MHDVDVIKCHWGIFRPSEVNQVYMERPQGSMVLNVSNDCDA